jgi:hypothetical protein
VHGKRDTDSFLGTKPGASLFWKVGYGNETPAEMPKPLHVGQRVTARHPVTRHLHDGDVLTVAPNCYRCACCLLRSCSSTRLLCPGTLPDMQHVHILFERPAPVL